MWEKVQEEVCHMALLGMGSVRGRRERRRETVAQAGGGWVMKGRVKRKVFREVVRSEKKVRRGEGREEWEHGQAGRVAWCEGNRVERETSQAEGEVAAAAAPASARSFPARPL